MLSIFLKYFMLIYSLTPAPELSRAEMFQRTRYGFQYISERTGVTPEFLWSFYIWETGGKSAPLVNGYNYGGIQRKGKTVYFDSVLEGVEAWIDILNLSAFDKCKPLDGSLRERERCQKCFRQHGYHGGTWQKRYNTEVKWME